MNRSRAAHLGMLCLLPLCVQAAFANEAVAKPRTKSVRIVYLVSADRSVREDFRKGIETAAKDLQGWYAKQLGGPTFRLNDPVVEVVKSDKDAKWFTGGPEDESRTGDPGIQVGERGQAALIAGTHLRNKGADFTAAKGSP